MTPGGMLSGMFVLLSEDDALWFVFALTCPSKPSWSRGPFLHIAAPCVCFQVSRGPCRFVLPSLRYGRVKWSWRETTGDELCVFLAVMLAPTRPHAASRVSRLAEEVERVWL